MLSVPKPYLKNYKVFIKLDDMDTLMPELMRGGVVYFLPAKKVMPAAFFIGHSWNKKQALIKHMEAGSFWSVKSYEKIMNGRIREQLAKAPKPVIRMSEGAKMISL